MIYVIIMMFTATVEIGEQSESFKLESNMHWYMVFEVLSEACYHNPFLTKNYVLSAISQFSF